MFHSLKAYWRVHIRRSARPQSDGSFQVGLRSIYILPSREGLVMALLLLLMLIGSVNYGSNLGYLATFFLGGIWIISLFHTWRNLFQLKILSVRGGPVFAGNMVRFELLIQNPDSNPHPAVSLGLKLGAQQAATIDAASDYTYAIDLPAPKRGRLKLPELTLSSLYPLGLFYAWCYLPLDAGCIVYPKPAGQGEPSALHLLKREGRGPQGQGVDDFIGHRRYQPGDPPARIDWKVHARDKGMQSKRFAGSQGGGDYLFDWDRLEAMDIEARLSLLTRYLLWCEKRQLNYGLCLPGFYSPIGRGEQQLQRCLTALADFPG
jgi:uncharacterized protein (DUF58 family)